jgi:pimeloyl-ACP methyl ester carboxylesterase
MWLAMAPALLTQLDRLDRLAEVDVPTLVIVGEQDTPFVAHGERMAKTIPGARLAIIPDAGHSPQFENTGAWWAALSGFLEDVG